jgi:hypothetical protein
MANHKDAIVAYNEPINRGSSDSILAKMFRTIRDDLGLDADRLLYFVMRYVIKDKSLSQKETSSVIGNIKKELQRTYMSWKVFTKGLVILNVKELDLTLTLFRPGHEHSVHSITIDLRKNKIQLKDSDEDDEAESLSDLYKKILNNLNIQIVAFNNLVNDYIVDANIPVNLKEVSCVRGNIKKELLKSTMTWKVFIKGLKFVHVKKLKLKVDLHHTLNKTTSHEINVVLDTQYSFQDEV